MWQMGFRVPVGDNSRKGARERNQDRPVTGAYERVQGTRTRTDKCPTESEYDATCEVADFIERLRGKFDFLAFHRPYPERADQEDRERPYDHCASYDPVHVHRLKVEHLLYAEPADDFRLDEYDSKIDTKQKKLDQFHGKPLIAVTQCREESGGPLPDHR